MITIVENRSLTRESYLTHMIIPSVPRRRADLAQFRFCAQAGPFFLAFTKSSPQRSRAPRSLCAFEAVQDEGRRGRSGGHSRNLPQLESQREQSTSVLFPIPNAKRSTNLAARPCAACKWDWEGPLENRATCLDPLLGRFPPVPRWFPCQYL